MKMSKSRNGTQSSLLARERACGVARTLLITYGVAVSSYLFTRSVPAGTSMVYGGILSAENLVPIGLGLQVLMMVARMIIGRRLAVDADSAGQALLILELVGDGVTVLLFAVGTFGAILTLPDL